MSIIFSVSPKLKYESIACLNPEISQFLLNKCSNFAAKTHPDSQSSNNGQRKRRAKRPNYEGDQAKGRATWSDLVNHGIKESLFFGD